MDPNPAVTGPPAAGPVGEMRTWTSLNGRTLEAKLMFAKDETVMVETVDGTTLESWHEVLSQPCLMDGVGAEDDVNDGVRPSTEDHDRSQLRESTPAAPIRPRAAEPAFIRG